MPGHRQVRQCCLAVAVSCPFPQKRKKLLLHCYTTRQGAIIAEPQNVLFFVLGIIEGLPKAPIRNNKRQLRRVLVPVEKPKREWLGTAVIPYKPGTSETIRRILNTANIRVGFQRGNTLRSALVQLKDRLPANRTRDCVYKIKCSDCIKVYIGQTARELHTRIRQHKRKINKPPRNADEYRALLKDSAIAEHALDTGHKIDLENVEVLRRGLRSTSQRLMAEAVEIAKHPSVNRIEGVELARVWRTVLDQSS
ncbi:hypothetical protein CLF_107319 [Clonorchis sinensis]|uniref:C2H2-type domain-containing protein n=1 Tax=Clonorchis sinensis TaxID=79923 RepID=G7YGK3_CLOSI|nr:hypothetical protein CLF_107319 [Clonorchis sinensis]